MQKKSLDTGVHPVIRDHEKQMKDRNKYGIAMNYAALQLQKLSLV